MVGVRSWSGPCSGGPFDITEVVSRYPSGFLGVDRGRRLAWIYDWVPGEGRFVVRFEEGADLISDPSSYRNRWRAAQEREFDVIPVPDMGERSSGDATLMLPDISAGAIQGWEEAYPGAVFAGKRGVSIDLCMNELDLFLSTIRWMNVWADLSDPRRKYFRKFSGWQGPGIGSGNALWWNMTTRDVDQATNDYQWHQTIMLNSRCLHDPMAYEAIVSIVIGESSRTWDRHHPGR